MNTLRTILIVVFATISIFLNAQTKKVAVMETKNIEGISAFQSNMVRGGMEVAVANAQGYEGYDRAAFDQIMKEQQFQRSGAVDDKQIRELGQMAGVQYVLVTEASSDGQGFFILAKLLDVETGQYGNAENTFCNVSGQDIFNASNELGAKLFGGSYTTKPFFNRPVTENADVITITVGGVSFDMIKVEAGSFIMGCTSEQGGDCDSDESPYHRVTITQDYYIGKFEVTQELWEAVMGTNPSNWKAFDRPVEKVSWNDAQEFCAELNRMTGRHFRLPTEAEWEYAARGGKKSTNAKYSGSSSVSNVAWYDGNSGSQTHPVGKLRPNELGIYDMSGNVWEWCQDWKGGYSSASQTDPQGPSSGSCRVLRGGSWFSYAGGCRVSNRSNTSPGYRDNSSGFRLVLPQ